MRIFMLFPKMYLFGEIWNKEVMASLFTNAVY